MKQWWTQPSYIQAVFGTLVALVAVLTGYFTGFFDVKRAQAELAIHELQTGTSKAAADYLQAKNALDKTSAELALRTKANDELSQGKQAYQQAVERLRKENEGFSNQIANLRAAGNSKAATAQAIAKLEKARSEEATQYQKLIDQLRQTNEELRQRVDTLSKPKPTSELNPPAPSPGLYSGHPIDTTTGTSFNNSYDPNVSTESYFKAHATAKMLDIYNQLPADQKRAMEVQAVLNHLEDVNRASNAADKGKERK